MSELLQGHLTTSNEKTEFATGRKQFVMCGGSCRDSFW